MPSELQSISDRLGIVDLLNRYARAMDAQDWDLLRTVFTPDAHIDYVSVGGPAGEVDTVLAWVAETMPTFPNSQHLVSNVETDVEGDEATVRAGYFAQIRTIAGGQFFCGGWYHHRLNRTDDGWRSRHMVDVIAWTDRQDEAIAALTAP